MAPESEKMLEFEHLLDSIQSLVESANDHERTAMLLKMRKICDTADALPAVNPASLEASVSLSSRSDFIQLQMKAGSGRKRFIDGDSLEQPLKKDKPTRKSSLNMPDQDELEPLNFALSPRVNTASLQALRDRIFEKTCSLRGEILKGGVPHITEFTPEEAMWLTNLWMNHIMGKRNCERISKIIQESQDSTRTDAGLAISLRADVLSIDSTTSPLVRKFYHAYTRATLYDTRNKKASAYSDFLQLWFSYDSYKEYKSLCQRHQSNDPEIVALFEAHQISTGQGIGKASLPRIYLDQTLGRDAKSSIISELDLNNQPLEALVTQFGRGILVLLPRYAKQKFRRLGTQRMVWFLQVLETIIGDVLRPLCQIADQQLFQQMINGDVLFHRGGAYESFQEYLEGIELVSSLEVSRRIERRDAIL